MWVRPPAPPASPPLLLLLLLPAPCIRNSTAGWREGGWERTRLSVSTPPWPPGGRQPENLNEIFKRPASYLQCVGRGARQRQAKWRNASSPIGRCQARLVSWPSVAALGLLRHDDGPRLHIRVSSAGSYDQSLLAAAFSSQTFRHWNYTLSLLLTSTVSVRLDVNWCS